MIHIRDKAKELIAKWEKIGFNSHRLFASIEGSDDPEPGEQTLAEKQEFDKNYVAFLVRTDFDHVESDDPYVEVTVNEDEFWEDFIEHEIKSNFGSDVVVKHHERCNEFEVYREKK